MSEHSPIPGKTPDQARRSTEAAVRKEAREARSASEQLGILDARPGEARKESLKLAKQMD